MGSTEEEFETENELIGAGDRDNTGLSAAIERRRRNGWHLHSAEKLRNGKMRLIFRRPIDS